MDNKQLSIITISLNNINGLIKTVDSVINQKTNSVELIVIDGNSVDGTKEYLHKRFGLIDKWISESDSGIYDAMNKGARLASGNYLLFLNSGDVLYNNAIMYYLEQIREKMYDIFYGQIYSVAPNKDLDISKIHIPSHLNLLFGMSIFHPSTLIQSALFSKMGMYDTNYKLAGDYKFILRCYYEKATFKYIDKPLAIFETGGLSSKNAKLSLKENINAKFEILPFYQFIPLIIYSILKFYLLSSMSFMLKILLGQSLYKKLIISLK